MAVAEPITRRAVDRRSLKLATQQMSRAFRDSAGGGLMERFEAVSKLLFTKIVDERRAEGRWGSLPAQPRQMTWRAGDTERSVYERTRSVWADAIADFPRVFTGTRSQFPVDAPAVARIVAILDPINLSDVPADVKGTVYEELLRNTFEKNENQQYFTPRHVVDFMVALCSPTWDDVTCDPACGSGGFLVGALAAMQVQDGGRLPELRGAEVDERMAWIARINMLMHGADPRSIYTLPGAGSLAPLDRIRTALPAGGCSLILTNPPFGSDMTDREALRSFVTGRRRTSRRRGVLFVERCLQLLGPGGRLAIVVDDSVLNLRGNSDLRELVRDQAITEAVISLPDVTFMPYSTAKSSILVVRRQTSPADEQGWVFMADVENVGNRPNGDPLYSDEYNEDGTRMLKSDLPRVLELHRQFAAGKAVDESFEGTTVFVADIDEAGRRGEEASRLDVFYLHPARRRAQAMLAGATSSVRRLGDLIEIDATAVNPAAEYGDTSVRWIGLGDIVALTGQYEVRDLPGDRVKSNAHVFRAGDVLFSRLRPKLRKAIRIPDGDEGGICSSELLVMRPRPDTAPAVSMRYIAYLLRSELVFGQLIYQITGVGRPRVSAQAVRQLQLPLPTRDEQEAIVARLDRAAADAEQRRAQARTLYHEATHVVEEAYLGVTLSLVGEAAAEAPRRVQAPPVRAAG